MSLRIKKERAEALKKSFMLCKDLLVVSVMLSSTKTSLGKPYGDGYVTKIGTFQKYYSQQMLKEYIDNILLVDSISVAPGVYFVFKNEDAEQAFYLIGTKLTELY